MKNNVLNKDSPTLQIKLQRRYLSLFFSSHLCSLQMLAYLHFKMFGLGEADLIFFLKKDGRIIDSFISQVKQG
jgi:hypothetical protein